MPEDFLNRQQLYIPKKYANQRNRYDYDNLDNLPVSKSSND